MRWLLERGGLLASGEDFFSAFDEGLALAPLIQTGRTHFKLIKLRIHVVITHQPREKPLALGLIGLLDERTPLSLYQTSFIRHLWGYWL